MFQASSLIHSYYGLEAIEALFDKLRGQTLDLAVSMIAPHMKCKASADEMMASLLVVATSPAFCKFPVDVVSRLFESCPEIYPDVAWKLGADIKTCNSEEHLELLASLAATHYEKQGQKLR